MIKRKTLFPNLSKISLSIDSFENGLSLTFDNDLTNMRYAKKLQNFSYVDGCLKNGLGISNLDTIFKNSETLINDFKAVGNIIKTFHFYKYNKETLTREDKLIFVNQDYNVYYINLYDSNISLNSLRLISFTSPPNAIHYRLNGEDVIIFSSETDNMIVWDGTNTPYEVLDAPKISSMALHYERLFTTVDGEKNAVWFSDDLDPTNWSVSLEEAGFIELIDERGALEKVISFCDYIYIFREYGISRLTAFGDQSQFSISNLFVSSGKIWTNSVCVCGDKILFLASDGLYKFDGVNTTKILSNIYNGFSKNNENCSACFHNGRYYLLADFYFDNEENAKQTILEIDVSSNKLTNIISDLRAKSLTAINCETFNGVVVTCYDEETENYIPGILNQTATIFEKSLLKQWSSPTTNLNDSSHIKILQSIQIDTLGPAILTINHDNQSTHINFAGKDSIQHINTFIPLKKFSFTLSSNSPTCEIKNLTFEFSKTKRR